MKKIQHILISLAGLVLAAACTFDPLQEQMSAGQNGKGLDVTFTATAARSDTGTKTAVHGDGPEIWWNPNDAIYVIFNGVASEFQYNGTEPVSLAEFKGSLYGFSGSTEVFEGEVAAGSQEFLGLYPNRGWDWYPDNTVYATVPALQTATAGSFDPNALMTIAKSNDLALAFYNVCGGVKFSLQEEGIECVTFTSNDGTPLAGKVKVVMDENGYPAVSGDVQNPESSIRLEAPYGEYFEPGVWYYLTCLPGSLEQGFTMTFLSGTKIGELSMDDPITVKRSVWGRLEIADATITYVDEDTLLYNEILYTTTDGNPIAFSSYDYTGTYSSPISHVYVNGVGRIRFAEPITQIPGSSFQRRTTLETIRLPKTVKSIGEYAFSDCTSLKEVRMSEGIEHIGTQAFVRNTALERISIPASLQSVGQMAFVRCDKLTTFGDQHTSDDGRCLILDGNLVAFAPAGVTEYTLPMGISEISPLVFALTRELKKVVIPFGVDSIGKQAFYSSSIESVTLPGSLLEIGSSAFAFSALTTLTVPRDVNTIESYAFAHCPNLKTVSLPYTLTVLGDGVFAADNALERFTGQFSASNGHLLVQDGTIKAIAPVGLTELTIPNTITEIASYAFNGISGLKKIVLEEGVTIIGDSAFYGCSDLEEITIPSTVEYFGSQVFVGCSSLKKFSGPYASGTGSAFLVVDGVLIAYALNAGLEYPTLPNNATSIADFAFAGCSLKGITTLPNTIKTIGVGAFSGSEQLIQLIFSAGLETIGEGAFENCPSLTNIPNLPTSLRSIGPSAFYNCPQLTAIPLNNGLEEIGDHAFQDCSAVAAITIPATVTQIGAYAFSGCVGLKAITVPASVTTISPYTFSNCTGLEELTLNNGLEIIGQFAFASCTGLTAINIPATVVRVDQYAFYEDENIASLTLNEGALQEIGMFAFMNFQNLTEVVVPSSVKTLGLYSIAGNSLTKVTLKATTPPSLPWASAQPFFNWQAQNSIELAVPASALSAYQNAYPWMYYNVTAIP